MSTSKRKNLIKVASAPRASENLIKLIFQVTDDTAELTHYVTVAMKIEDLTLRYTTATIRFRVDVENGEFEPIEGRLFLMCSANIESMPSVKRQTSEVVYIQTDELNSLRLINSSGCMLSKCISLIEARATKSANGFFSLAFSWKLFIIASLFFPAKKLTEKSNWRNKIFGSLIS